MTPATPVPEAADSLTVPDGTQIASRVWSPSVPRRGTVVIVHGLKDHGGRYDALAHELASAGLAVYAPDLRGHGRSGGIRSHVRRFSDFLDDLAEFVRYVRTESPTGPLFLIGHSMGGAISLGFVLDGRARVDGLILTSPALAAAPTVRGGTKAIARLLSAVAPRARIYDLPDASFTRDPMTLDELAADPLVFHGRATARLAAELLRQMDRNRPRFGAIDVPMLVLFGTRDLLVDPRAGGALVERTRSGDTRLEILDGWYHDLLHEPDRARAVRMIVDWLAIRLPDA